MLFDILTGYSFIMLVLSMYKRYVTQPSSVTQYIPNTISLCLNDIDMQKMYQNNLTLRYEMS